MFERFTTSSRDVAVGAEQAARELRHAYIGTEHLLISLLRQNGGVAYTVLTGAGLSADQVRDEVARQLGERAPFGLTDASALESIGIDLEAVRAKVEAAFGPGALDPPAPERRRGLFRSARRPAGTGGHIPFTPRSKKVLELSLREALRLKHTHIGPEHILLGLLTEGEGLAAKVIHDAGIDLEDLKREILAALPKAA